MSKSFYRTLQLLLISGVALLFSFASFAGDFEEGYSAYIRKDYSLAFDRFKKSSESGVGAAHNNLGVLYATGMGVNRNTQEAYKFFKLAEKMGDISAKANLVILALSSKDIKSKFSYAELAKLSQAAERAGISTGTDYLMSASISSSGPHVVTRAPPVKDSVMEFNHDSFLSQLTNLIEQQKFLEACELYRSNQSGARKALGAKYKDFVDMSNKICATANSHKDITDANALIERQKFSDACNLIRRAQKTMVSAFGNNWTLNERLSESLLIRYEQKACNLKSSDAQPTFDWFGQCNVWRDVSDSCAGAGNYYEQCMQIRLRNRNEDYFSLKETCKNSVRSPIR